MTLQTAIEVRENYRKSLGKDFGDLFYLALNEWCDLQQIWAQFENLFGHGPERVALMNAAGGGFFYYVDRLFFEAAMLSLCRLSDRKETFGKQNLTVMLFMNFMDTDIRGAELQILLDKVFQSTEFARDWRNRRLAHNDLGLKLGTASPLQDATRNHINLAIATIHNVLEFVTVDFMKTNLSNTVIAGLNNEMVMLHRLHLGVEYNKKILSDLEVGNMSLDEWPSWLQNK